MSDFGRHWAVRWCPGHCHAVLLRTGEESFDIPHGPEQPGLDQVSA
jgi:hypothetical protein